MRKIGIACINHLNGIGYKNNLLYSIPKEMSIFKTVTTHSDKLKKGNIVVMGKNTFRSLNNKPLKNRLNCVITSNAEKLHGIHTNDNLRFFSSIESVLEFGEDQDHNYDNMFICGGSSIYKYFIDNNLLDYLVISQINNHACNNADTFFPDYGNNYAKLGSNKHFNNNAVLLKTKDKLKLDFTYNIYSNTMSSNVSTEYSDTLKFLTVADNKLRLINPNLNYSNESTYLSALENVLFNGDKRSTRNSETISKFGVNMEFDISENFPLLTTKRVYWNGVIKELLWFLKGNTNAGDLNNDKVKIWDGNSSREFLDSRGLNNYEVGDCGPIYGYQWRHFNATYKGMNESYENEGVDQLQEIIDLIKNDPMSRRMIMSSWNPTQLPEMCLPPCHVLYQFYVRIDEDGLKHLSCQMYQRSGDMFLGIPFNIASTSALTYILCHLTGCKPDKVNINIGDAHIYSEHVEAVKTQLLRTPCDSPKLNILGPPKKSIDDYKIDDFVIENYLPQSIIKAPMIA
tara:strand:- start:2141 stop:3679 length:1539 start_codon:yes stop_codon:yes gene_type:complete